MILRKIGYITVIILLVFNQVFMFSLIVVKYMFAACLSHEIMQSSVEAREAA